MSASSTGFSKAKRARILTREEGLRASAERERWVMRRKNREREKNLLNPVSKICESDRKCRNCLDIENGGVFR